MNELPLFEIEVDDYRVYLPELRLWAEVLLLAVEDATPWIRKKTIMSQGQREQGKNAMNWICSESRRKGGFIWTCGILNLDYDSVRAKLGVERKKIW